MKNYLKEINGKQIRRQYFNFPIYMFLSVYLLVVEITAIVPLTEGEFVFQKWIGDTLNATFTILIFIIPCFILSLLNRFFFGKLVCVCDNQGIHYKDGFIKWNDILCVEYNITHIGRFSFRPAYIDIISEKESTQIECAPLYIFSVIKQFAPNIKTKTDKMIFVLAITVIVIGIVIPCIV